ncbi:MAG: hypothetical protein GC192_06305 [Bacteroidetes bacterium]|nr:hypothetical protein [Bacteroidota bacterium]
MKKNARKTTIYIAFASLLLMSCVRINNVKLIMDNHALFGFELDLSEAEFSFRGTSPRTDNADITTTATMDEESTARP